MCRTPLYANKHKYHKEEMTPPNKQLEVKMVRTSFLCVRKSQRTSQHETQNVKTHNGTTQNN